MKLIVVVTALLLSACNSVTNTFEVRAPGTATAELQLCGQSTALNRSGAWLVKTQPITCEGEGAIVVRVGGEPPVKCHVGYVAPGAVQTFRFKVEGRDCQPFDV